MSELQYVLQDSGASVVVADARFVETGHALAKSSGVPFVVASNERGDSSWDDDRLPAVSSADGASILYTSGAVGKQGRVAGCVLTDLGCLQGPQHGRRVSCVLIKLSLHRLFCLRSPRVS
jgi:hypothetical protein